MDALPFSDWDFVLFHTGTLSRAHIAGKRFIVSCAVSNSGQTGNGSRIETLSDVCDDSVAALVPAGGWFVHELGDEWPKTQFAEHRHYLLRRK